jgi:hypothetical protein
MSDDLRHVEDLLAEAGIAVSDGDVRLLAEKLPKMRKVVARLRVTELRDVVDGPAHKALQSSGTAPVHALPSTAE